MNRDLNRLNNLIYGDDVFVASGGSQGADSATSDNNMTDVQKFNNGGNNETSTQLPPSDTDNDSILNGILDSETPINQRQLKRQDNMGQQGQQPRTVEQQQQQNAFFNEIPQQGQSITQKGIRIINQTTSNIVNTADKASDLVAEGVTGTTSFVGDTVNTLGNVLNQGIHIVGDAINTTGKYAGKFISSPLNTTKNILGMEGKQTGGMDADQLVDYLLETETDVAPMRQMGGHYDPELQQRLQRFFS